LGETFEEAITREAMEEAGAAVKIGKLLHAHLDWFAYRPNVFYQTIQLYYEAELTAELVQPTDQRTEWRGFIPLSDQKEKYPLPPIVEKVIKENIQ
jgi:8-oxo-dGTP pyrophosphatase MutT (NUDIX family)